MVDEKNINLQIISFALGELRKAKPLLKKEILKTCLCLIELDQKIGFQEYEMLRLISETLLVPMPLIKPGEFFENKN